jgi:hypothetical protein
MKIILTMHDCLPLTLTLSPRRGNSQRMLLILRKLVRPIPSRDYAKARQTIFPLPEGEGRDEGKRELDIETQIF